MLVISSGLMLNYDCSVRIVLIGHSIQHIK